MAMALHIAADDGAVKDVEGCEQRGGAVTFVVCVIVPARPGFNQQTRLGFFSSTERTTAWAGGST